MFENHSEFYGSKLRLARQMKGYTLQQLGEAASVSRQHIHQLESQNDKAPTESVMMALAEALDVEEGFFYEKLHSEVVAEQCHFRKRKTTPVGVVHRVVAYSTLFEELISLILDEYELPVANFAFMSDRLGNSTDYTPELIEEVALATRNHWGLGIDAPIDDMTSVLENNGAIISCFSAVSEKVDALSVHRTHPLILRDQSKESACRMRFDLAHECGHLIMHEGIETGDNKTESEANQFASAFLLPRGAFTAEFLPCVAGGRFSWKALERLKLRWKVSLRAIIYRAHYLGLITAQQYRYANVYLNKKGFTKDEPVDNQISMEAPKILATVFDLMDSELNISFHDIAAKLQVKPVVLSELTGVLPREPSNVVRLGWR